MMSLWDALRMNMMISYQELVRTFPRLSVAIQSDIDYQHSCWITALLEIKLNEVNDCQMYSRTAHR
ncbi:hypothetical protein E5P35_21045 [Escherichia coli]|nr:hypothetical protein E5P35_21045 [Escherichia coli]